MAAVVPFIPLMLQGAGLTMSLLGGLNQARGSQQAAQYNANVAMQNAHAARAQAAANADAQARKARLAMGQARVGYGAAGVRLEGSAIDVLEQSAAMAELDRQNILYGGATSAAAYESKAGLDLWQGANQSGNLKASAIGSALTMGLGIYKDWPSNKTGGGGFTGGATGEGTDYTLNRMG